MIPILASIVVGQNPTKPRAFLLSASYVLGMSVTYALVGVLMGLFGAGLNLQAHLQSAPVLITFAILFSLFALAMFGAFDLRVSPRLAGKVDTWQARAQRSGPLGLAAAGALSVLVVSPCVTAPPCGRISIHLLNRRCRHGRRRAVCTRARHGGSHYCSSARLAPHCCHALVAG